MKVHIGSDEKFSCGLFARFEFLHSLQVVFQFINTTSVLRIGKFVRRRAFIFRFFQSCPLPASSDEVFKFIFVSVYLLPQQKLFTQNIKAGKFSFSAAESSKSIS